MAAGLTSLPVELLVSISAHLTTLEYGALRRSCKAIEQALFHFWATEFFTVRQIWLYTTSLQNLVDISQHEKLNQYVKKIIIGLDCLAGPGSLYYRDRAMPATLAVQSEFDDIVANQTWKGPISTALMALPSPQSVQFRDFVSEHHRPRENTPWRGYGIKTFTMALGDDLYYDVHPAGLRGGEVLMSQFIELCAQKGIEILAIENICRATPTIIGSLRIGNGEMQSYSACMRHLTSFFATVAEGPLPIGTKRPKSTSFCHLLNSMPSLRHLRINIPFWYGLHNNSLRNEIADAGQVTTDELFKEIAWTKAQLNRLELGMAYLNIPLLFDFLANSKHCLQHLTLHRIRTQSRNGWHELLDRLTELVSLKSLTINSCREQNPVGWKTNAETELRVSFLKTASVSIVWPAKNSIKLTGANGTELGQIAASRVVFPREVLEASSAEDIARQRVLRIRFEEEAPLEELASEEDTDDESDSDGFVIDEDDLSESEDSEEDSNNYDSDPNNPSGRRIMESEGVDEEEDDDHLDMSSVGD